MANLIITIISIGLVAIAAIMGAYYGGTAFVQGQSKAYANTVASQGDQIAAAWNVYAANNGGAYTNISSLSQLSTSPTYLASLPIPPQQVANTATPSWFATDLTSITGASTVAGQTSPGSTTAATGGVYFRLTDDQNGANTCNYVAQIVGGSSAYPTGINTSTNLLAGSYVSTSTALATRKLDCVVYGQSTTASALSTSTTPKYVYYRVF